ncbi:MAG: OmpA family protein [Marinibacterium sp.]|nr:OmpA family protein [Marinibacterium sp.]
MPDLEDMTPGQVLAEASVADFIKSLGLSIAEAQKALDENSVNQMGEFITARDSLGGKSLLDMGLMPAFYHYQHADITCSMQLSLRVEKNIGVGVNIGGSFSDTSTSNDSETSSSSSTESGSSTRTQTRSANVDINVASQGALTVGGQNFPLTGDSPRARIEGLADAIRGQQDITRAIPIQNCTPVTPTPTTSVSDGKVVCSPNAVAFIGGGFENGLIRISRNPGAAQSPETYRMNGSTSVDVTRSNTVAAYAAKVKDAINATAFTAVHIAAGDHFYRVFFDVDKAFIRSNDDAPLRNLAQFMKKMGLSAKVNGYASRTSSDSHNQTLSEERAKAVRNRLIANGVDPAKLQVQSFGEDRWRSEGVPDGLESQPHRVVEIMVDTPDHYIWVDGDDANQLDGVTPDKLSANSRGNGWVFLYDALGLDGLNGQTVTIKGQSFQLDGASASGTPVANSAEAFARNLATAVNGNASVQVQASAAGNVTNLCNQGDSYRMILVTSSNRQISLSGTSGVTVTESFTRTTSSSGTRENTGNRTVAVGASVDVRYARQFEMNVTGNSSISARLVSIPAPPQFLDTIKSFLDQGGEG